MDKDKAIEAARALVRGIENCQSDIDVTKIRCWQQYRSAKEALEDKPSREEVVGDLQIHKSILSTDGMEITDLNPVELCKTLTHAIELLKQPVGQSKIKEVQSEQRQLNKLYTEKLQEIALEDKPTREEVIAFHQTFSDSLEVSEEKDSNDYRMTQATIELLKQLTMQWVENTGKAPDCKRVIAKCYDGYGYDLYENDVADLDFNLDVDVRIVAYMVME